MKRFARESSSAFEQPPARMFLWPLEMMLRFNANMANTLQQTTVAWAQRRQEAADDAIQTFDRLIHSRDVGEAVGVQQEWFEGSIRRLDDDLNAIASQTANLSHKAGSTAREAVAQSSSAVRDEASQAEQTGSGNGHNPEESNDERGQETHHGGKHSKVREHHRRAS
jgi:hypothetical protein